MAQVDRRWDRAAGVLVGQACGDALGVPYEFSAPPVGEPLMLGGGLGPYRPGEWSDDTQMAVCIAQVSATGADLSTAAALDEIAAGFETWFAGGASDVGTQTRALLEEVRTRQGRRGQVLRQAAEELHTRTGRTAGNGALMRTAVVGLSRLEDPAATAAAARAVAELTHIDPLAGDSCVLWSELVRTVVHSGPDAVQDGMIPLGVELLPRSRRGQWHDVIGAVLDAPSPSHFDHNGYTVSALQAAYCAVLAGLRAAPDQLVRAGLVAAVSAGHDTDTVAAIAGGVLGGLAGLEAIPARWVRAVHGWPGMRAAELAALGRDTLRRGMGACDPGPPGRGAHAAGPSPRPTKGGL